MMHYEGPRKTPNNEAGIDLITILYNKYGLATSILIFCGDDEVKQRATACLKKHRVRQDAVYKVTKSEDDVLQYILAHH